MQESDAAELALLSPAVTDGAAVSTVLGALQSNLDVMALQATGAWALWGLVRGSKENSMRAVSLGAPQSLVTAMQRHAGACPAPAVRLTARVFSRSAPCHR